MLAQAYCALLLVLAILFPPSIPMVTTVPSGTVVHSSPLPPSTLSLYRFKLWWFRPQFTNTGCGRHELNPCTTLLLTRDDDNPASYTCIIPFNNSYLKTSSSSDVVVYTDGDSPCSYCRKTGPDPYALVRDITDIIAPPPPCAKSRSTLPKLGWATWNSFYTDLSPAAILSSAKSITSKVPLSWLLIDDGWQSTDIVETTGKGEGWLERSDSKSIIPPSYTTNNLPLVAFLLASPIIPTLIAHRRRIPVGG